VVDLRAFRKFQVSSICGCVGQRGMMSGLSSFESRSWSGREPLQISKSCIDGPYMTYDGLIIDAVCLDSKFDAMLKTKHTLTKSYTE
jgi:hypothetical protein